MRRDVTAALRLTLPGHLSLRKSRLESFCVLVIGVLLSRTVNLSHLACMFPTRAAIASNYRRLQRFFAQVILDGSQLARVIVRIVGLGTGPWLLALDRTCWKFGRHDINVLMLAIIRNGIAIPVMWDVLGRAGNSTTAQRSALLSRFCAVFGESAIAGLIADREFIGRAWMTSLAERDIPFILRLKDTFHVRLSAGRQGQVRSLFRKVGVGGRRYIHEDCRLGSRDSSLGPPLKLAATRLVSGDLLVVATNTDPKIAFYRSPWPTIGGGGRSKRSLQPSRRAASTSRIPTSFTPTGSASFSLCWPWPLRSPTRLANGRRNPGRSSSRPTNAALNRSSGSALIC